MSGFISKSMIAALVTWTMVLVPALANAGLCAACAGKMHILNIGKCVSCGAATASGSFSLCPACSAAKHQCEACGAALTVVPQIVPPVVKPVVKPVEPPVVKPVEKPAVENTTEVKPAVVAPAVK